MQRENYNDLLAFIAVARERSFTKAAAQMGVSQSSLSHTIRALETRIGVRLLTRTTRSVSPTEAGARLMNSVPSFFDEIDAEVQAVTELRDLPSGTIRITATDHTTRTILWPKLSAVLRQYPEIRVEIITDYGLSDIVAAGYDIGVRTGSQVAKDMIAVRIGPDARMAIVGSPDYLKGRDHPKVPQDLTAHSCINLRLPTYGGFYAWELKKGKREVQARVDGQVAFNGTYELLSAAIAGYGLAYVPEDIADEHIESGRLVRLMEDWCPRFPGLHAYYPSRRQSSRAMAIVIEALRYRT